MYWRISCRGIRWVYLVVPKFKKNLGNPTTKDILDPPKPTFVPEVFNESLHTVVADITSKTLVPTPFPTPPPAGYVVKKVKKKAVTATTVFPLSADAIKTLVMKKALETGTAKSIGKAPEDAQITAINGEHIESIFSRSLQSNDADVITTVKFTIASFSNDDTAGLIRNFSEALAKGSAAAYWKREAYDSGVLEKALKNMPSNIILQ
jgi:hypothetical protein